MKPQTAFKAVRHTGVQDNATSIGHHVNVERLHVFMGSLAPLGMTALMTPLADCRLVTR